MAEFKRLKFIGMCVRTVTNDKMAHTAVLLFHSKNKYRSAILFTKEGPPLPQGADKSTHNVFVENSMLCMRVPELEPSWISSVGFNLVSICFLCEI